MSNVIPQQVNMASDQQEVDVFESWEDLEETDILEQKLTQLMTTNRSAQNSSASCNGNMNGTPFKIILTGDDALRTQYVPPEPTVKILKRPTKSAPAADNKTVQPKKTLQQREKEYAQARLRILGEAQSSDKVDDKVCSIQGKQSVVRPPDCDNVIRLPKGPDGTKGFNVRR